MRYPEEKDMLETLGKIFTFLGEREKNYKIKKAERELKKERKFEPCRFGACDRRGRIAPGGRRLRGL